MKCLTCEKEIEEDSVLKIQKREPKRERMRFYDIEIGEEAVRSLKANEILKILKEEGIEEGGSLHEKIFRTCGTCETTHPTNDYVFYETEENNGKYISLWGYRYVKEKVSLLHFSLYEKTDNENKELIVMYYQNDALTRVNIDDSLTSTAYKLKEPKTSEEEKTFIKKIIEIYKKDFLSYKLDINDIFKILEEDGIKKEDFEAETIERENKHLPDRDIVEIEYKTKFNNRERFLVLRTYADESLGGNFLFTLYEKHDVFRSRRWNLVDIYYENGELKKVSIKGRPQDEDVNRLEEPTKAEEIEFIRGVIKIYKKDLINYKLKLESINDLLKILENEGIGKEELKEGTYPKNDLEERKGDYSKVYYKTRLNGKKRYLYLDGYVDKSLGGNFELILYQDYDKYNEEFGPLVKIYYKDGKLKEVEIKKTISDKEINELEEPKQGEEVEFVKKVISIYKKDLSIRVKQEIKISSDDEGKSFVVKGMPDDYKTLFLLEDPNGILYFIDMLKSEEELGIERADLCIFVGRPGEKMKQARLLEVRHYMDGGTLNIDFELDGKKVRIHFPPEPLGEERRENLEPTLSYEDKEIGLKMVNWKVKEND